MMALWSILLIACSSYFQKEAARMTAATKCVAFDSWSRRQSFVIQRMATHAVRLGPRCGLLMVFDSFSVSPQIDMEDDVPNQSRNEQINAKDLSINKKPQNKQKVFPIFYFFFFKFNVEEMLSWLLTYFADVFFRAESNRPHQSPCPLWPCSRQV